MATDPIRNKAVIEDNIDPFIKNTYKKWKTGNDILYDMCEKYPGHTDIDEIAAKAWIIGKSYSTQLERYLRVPEGQDFYYDGIAKAILSIGDELDENIRKFKKEKVNRENIDIMFSIHSELVNCLQRLSIEKKTKYKNKDSSARSFASKYLHFHCPEFFFIYDSRANSIIPKFVRKPEDDYDGDPVYVEFGLRLLHLQEYIDKKYHEKITPRQIDNFLLEMEANKKNIKWKN